MAKTVFRVDTVEGRRELVPVDPDSIRGGERVEVPQLRGADLQAGVIPPHILPHIQALEQRQESALLCTAFRMSQEQSEAYGVLGAKLREGKSNRARLLLLVAQREPAHIETAAIAVMDEKVDDGKVDALVAALSRGEAVSDLGKRLSALIPPQPAKPRPAPATRPPPARVELARAPERPRAVEPPRPQITPEEEVENEVTENIMRNFLEGQWEEAEAAYRGLREGGRQMTTVEWRNVFHAVGRLHDNDYPQEKLLYFKHILLHPGDVGLLVDNDRISSAFAIMNAALGEAPSQQLREKAFRATFLNVPSGFRLVTDHGTAAQSAVAKVSDNPEHRVDFLLHMQADAEDTRYFEMATDHNTVSKARDVADRIGSLAARCRIAGMEGLDREIFRGVFIRSAGDFALTSGDVVSRNLGVVMSDPHFLRLLWNFAGQYAHLAARNPEVLANIGRKDGDMYPLNQLIDAGDNRSDWDNRIRDYFDAMISNGGLARELTRPEVIYRAIENYRVYGKYVNPSIILDPDFMCRGPEYQQRTLDLYRRAIEEPTHLEAVESHEVSPPQATRRPAAAEPRAGRIPHAIVVHGFRIPNPPAQPPQEFAGESGGFRMLDNAWINMDVLAAMGRLPYEQQQIVNLLSGRYDRGFQIETGRLLELMQNHPHLHEIYRRNQANLGRDISELAARGIIYPPTGDAIRLSDSVINLEERPVLPEGAEDIIRAKLPPSRYPELDGAIVVTLARMANYLAVRRNLTTMVLEQAAASGVADRDVAGRIDALEDQGVLVNPDPGKGLIILSLGLISQVPGMRIPKLYQEQYSHVLDAAQRVMRMYQVTFSSDRPAHSNWPPALESRGYAIDHAVELVSSGGRSSQTLPGTLISQVERRQMIVRALANLSLDHNHGDKLEDIRAEVRMANLTGVGLTEGSVGDVLTELVRGGLVERVALGYYRIDPKYWAKTPSKPGEIEYTPAPDYAVMHGNIREADILRDVSNYVTESQRAKAIPLLRLLSHRHISIPYGARAVDLAGLLHIEGIPVPISQVRDDLAAMTVGVQPGERVVHLSKGRTVEHEVGFWYPPMIRKMGSHSEVYWKLEVPTTNMTVKDALARITPDLQLFDVEGGRLPLQTLIDDLGGRSERPRVDYRPLAPDVTIADVQLERRKGVSYFVQHRDGTIEAVIIWESRRD